MVDCDDVQDNAALELSDAIKRVLQCCTPIKKYETVDLVDALGRILAEQIIAPRDVPGYDNSAMDGYALAGADLPSRGEKKLILVGKSLAGAAFNKKLESNQCIRITTGAMMPAGADTVVMQEHVKLLEGEQVLIDDQHKPKQHVRYADNDIAAGATVLKAGKCLSAADLGVIASLGLETVPVVCKVKVSFFSSGDEIKTLGEPLAAGDIYNSSRYSIGALIEKSGAELLKTSVLKDNYTEVKQGLLAAAEDNDVIITTGGVSVGEADYIKDALEEVGEVGFWKIEMKPGRPLAFGRLGTSLFFGLPGNPVSSMATFMQVVQPALQKLSGRDPLPEKIRISATATENIRKRPGRIDFQRGILSYNNGAYVVSSTGAQSSGQLSSMSEANCFIVLAADAGDVSAGDNVMVEPFETLY